MKFIAVLIATACVPAEHAAADATYAAQVLSCVDKANTLAESKACRAQVDAAWKVDGGSHD